MGELLEEVDIILAVNCKAVAAGRRMFSRYSSGDMAQHAETRQDVHITLVANCGVDRSRSQFVHLSVFDKPLAIGPSFHQICRHNGIFPLVWM